MKETFTQEDLIHAIRKLKEGDNFEMEQREKRRLKDYSKMQKFYDNIKTASSTLEGEERDNLMRFAETIEMLAQGYWLVMGEKMFNAALPELKKLEVPDEVIANIFVSKSLSATSTPPLSDVSK